MKTKHGNCNECQLVTSKKYSDTYFVSNNNDISNLDVYIVCDFTKYGEKLIDVFKDKFSDLKYGISNFYLCDNSGFSNIDHCKCANNCFKNIVSIHNKCNPKRSFTLGFDYPDNNLFEKVGSVEELVDILSPDNKETQHNEYYSIKIPEKYYTEDYRLVDVQYIDNQDRLIYIFRDKDNKKEFFEFPQYQNNFYWYEAVGSNKIIEDIKNLQLKTGKYKDRNRTIRGYYGDVTIAMQHSVDYFLNNKKEAPIVKSNIMFFDIETYQYRRNVFPNPDTAEYPITAISFRTDDKDDIVHVYMLALEGEIDNRVWNLKDKFPFITIFKDEATMLRAFFNKLHNSSIDFIAGWNINGFDIPYIVKRMRNIGIDTKELSPYGCVYADKSGRNQIAGYHCMDQLKLFKDLTYQTQPSYSLNSIANVVLGKEKVKHEESIDDMYHDNIEKFMSYSQTDTQLIYEIELEEQHISLQDEIRRVATVSQQGANSTIGQAEGLYATELKKKGYIARNYTHDVIPEKFPGAYVYDSKGGLFIGLLCDFDYTSLYPTIIRTFNIGNDSYIAKIDPDIARKYVFDRNSLRGQSFKITLDPIHANKTIMIDFNKFEEFMKKYQGQLTIVGTIFCGHEIHPATNCEILAMLMASRKIYKSKMLDAKEKKRSQEVVEFNNKQLAFKILANSLYGVLGAEHWRFYCPDLGRSITLTGQEMLKYAAERITHYMDGKINENKHPIDPRYENIVNDVRRILYGDTDSVFVNLTEYLTNMGISFEDKERCNKEIDKIQKFYNNIAIPELLKLHNVNTKYSVMNLKNEFLFSRYYTLEGSKHYCSHVISQEGKKVDFIDIKGLEVKRSEIPELSQKMLTELIDTIMDESIPKYQLKDKLDSIAKTYEEKMIKVLENHEVGVARISAFSKDIKEYKTIPSHVKAMLLWNEITGVEDFKHGTKGKLWNILGFDLDKAPKHVVDNYHSKIASKYNSSDIKCICTPEDVEKLPEWCIIDTKKMLEYACKDRVANLLNPLWKESENDNDLLF